MSKNILIVDDNHEITKILSDYILHEGYTPIIASDGEIALRLFAENEIDLILLDIMLPKLDGFEVCRTIRKESSVPIIMVTAKGDDFEKILGLDIGADDYIVKPFSPAEVMARVRAILRRVDKDEGPKRLEIDNLVLEVDQNRAFLNGKKIDLTLKEADLLYLLASNPSRVFTRDMLLDQLWGYDYYGDARTVDSHIKRLRAKLDGEHPGWDITTVRGRGYQFEIFV
ncbi:MAG TPA: response regulator transcription factor [Clostridiaceae bacterium]|nr:response regulator transcription factor [Clostridiaceae bacterium]